MYTNHGHVIVITIDSRIPNTGIPNNFDRLMAQPDNAGALATFESGKKCGFHGI